MHRIIPYLVIIVGLLLPVAKIANAYALPGTAGTTTPNYAAPSFYFGGWNSISWQNLSAPFENFTESLQSISNANLKLNILSSVPIFSNKASEAAHNALGQFDAWLVNVTDLKD